MWKGAGKMHKKRHKSDNEPNSNQRYKEKG